MVTNIESLVNRITRLSVPIGFTEPDKNGLRWPLFEPGQFVLDGWMVLTGDQMEQINDAYKQHLAGTKDAP